MGMYLNPGNSGFKRILKDYYVDKTGMIELINNRIDSMANLIYNEPINQDKELKKISDYDIIIIK